MSSRYNLVNNSLSDLDRSLHVVLSVAITATYRRGTRYLLILILVASLLRSSISITDELQFNPDFKLYFLDIRWVSISSSLFLMEY